MDGDFEIQTQYRALVVKVEGDGRCEFLVASESIYLRHLTPDEYLMVAAVADNPEVN